MTALMSTHRYTRPLTVVLAVLALSAPSAQTKITPDRNKYTPAQDVELGQKAAAEARRQLPMLNDERVKMRLLQPMDRAVVRYTRRSDHPIASSIVVNWETQLPQNGEGSPRKEFSRCWF